jgi:hypothetical protein
MGTVHRRVSDPDQWGADIRAQARADKIKVRTGTADADQHVVWAFLQHLDKRQTSPEDLARVGRQLGAVPEAMERAVLRRHKVKRVIRAENQRAAAVCEHCGARLYVDWSTTPAFMEGEVFDVECTG